MDSVSGERVNSLKKPDTRKRGLVSGIAIGLLIALGVPLLRSRFSLNGGGVSASAIRLVILPQDPAFKVVIDPYLVGETSTTSSPIP